MFGLTEQKLLNYSLICSILFCLSLYARNLTLATVFFVTGSFLWIIYIQQMECKKRCNSSS